MKAKILNTHKVDNTSAFTAEWGGYHFHIVYGQFKGNWFVAIPNWNICVDIKHPQNVEENAMEICRYVLRPDENLDGVGFGLAEAIKEHWTFKTTKSRKS